MITDPRRLLMPAPAFFATTDIYDVECPNGLTAIVVLKQYPGQVPTFVYSQSHREKDFESMVKQVAEFYNFTPIKGWKEIEHPGPLVKMRSSEPYSWIRDVVLKPWTITLDEISRPMFFDFSA